MSKPFRQLPVRPDLQQLKRQAKELLRAVLVGEPHALAEAREHGGAAAPEDYALHDAQFALARSYGFDSWPKLKAYVDGIGVKHLITAVRTGNFDEVAKTLKTRPELIHMDAAGDNEHRALHYAVLGRAPEMVRLLMAHGADARKGIYPHRDATGALTIATERGYGEIVAIIEEEEGKREKPSGEPAPDNLAFELMQAISSGENEQAIGLLEGNLELVNAVMRGGLTPLHAAAGFRNERLVVWLLEHGAEVNRTGPGEKTPLDQAVGGSWHVKGNQEQFVAVAGLLRAGGAELTVRAAVALNEAAWLQARHGEGKLTNPIEAWGGLLSVAAMHDRAEMLTLLLDLGLDPDERTRVAGLEPPEFSWGMPLWHCAASGKHALAELLLENKADPNGRVYASGSPMFQAYGQRDSEMVELLGRYGGAVDAVTVGLYRETALAVRMLAGEVDPQLSEGSFAGETAAEQLLWGGACGGDAEIVRMALERVDWPREDSRWYRILEQPLRFWNHGLGHWSKPEWDRGTYLECFRMVLENCDANVSGRFGLTILHDLAASRNRMTPNEGLGFAQALLDAGARLDVRDDLLKSTPLGWACRWGRMELVKLLLERGADPLEADAEPWAAPKAWAEKADHPEIQRLLDQPLTEPRP